MTYSECPNCGKKISNNVFSANPLVSDFKRDFINQRSNHPKEGYCDSCYSTAYNIAKKHLEERIKELHDELLRCTELIPILTLQSPKDWDYTIIGMVTAQSTTGTGVFSEISASFTDFLGMQSDTYNKKISAGENLCKNKLRREALSLGGNAIIGTDIDYAELGGGKGMIMVCMSGTCINLKNPEIISENFENDIKNLPEINRQYLSYKNTLASSNPDF